VRRLFSTAALRRMPVSARARSQRCPSSGATYGHGPTAAFVVKRLGMMIAVVSSVVSSTDNHHAIPLGTFIDIAYGATGQTHQQGHSHRSY